MMKRSMQVFVKGSREALELYQKAFRAEILCKDPDEHGNYMHAELAHTGGENDLQFQLDGIAYSGK